MLSANENKTSWKDFTLKVQDILKEKSFTSRNSYLHQATMEPGVTTSEKPLKSKMLQSFFEEKKSKIMPETGFRSLLENPPISPRTFKKRIGINNDEIQRLKI